MDSVPDSPSATPAPGIRLVVGLGNPGPNYERTRHNIGFMIVDRLAARARTEFRLEASWQAEVATAGKLRLCKPLSYMNLSGGPVGAVSRFYKITPAEMLVVFDDTALPLGRLRLRARGSAGGHNGMQSILDQLGTEDIPRLRVGIGAPAGGEMTGHVLGRFTAEELPGVERTVARAVEAIDFTQTHGLPAAMNQFNQPTNQQS